MWRVERRVVWGRVKELRERREEKDDKGEENLKEERAKEERGEIDQRQEGGNRKRERGKSGKGMG